ADPLAQIQVVDFVDTNSGTPAAVEIHDNTLKGTGTGNGLFFRVDSTAISEVYSNTLDNFQTGINMALNNGELSMADNIVSNSAVGLDAMQTGSYTDVVSTGTLNMVDNDLCSNKNDFNCKNIPNYLISGLACDKMTSGSGCGSASCHLTCSQVRASNTVSVYALNADDPAKLTDAGSLLSLAKIRHSQEQAKQVKINFQQNALLTKTEYDMTPATAQATIPSEQNSIYQLDLSKFPKGTYAGTIQASFNSGPVGTSSVQFSWSPPEKAGPVEIKLPSGLKPNCDFYPGDATDYSIGETCDINDGSGNTGTSLDFNAIDNGFSPGELKSCTFNNADDKLFTLKLNEDASKKYDIYINDMFVGSMYGGESKDMQSSLFYYSQPDANTVSLVHSDPFSEETELITFDVYANYMDTQAATILPVRPFAFTDDFLFYKPYKPESAGAPSEYFAFKVFDVDNSVKNVYVIFETDDGFGNAKTISEKLTPMKIDENYNYYSVLPKSTQDPNDPFKKIVKGYIFVTNKQGKSKSQNFEIRLSEIHDWALESYGESYDAKKDCATCSDSTHVSEAGDPDINYFEASRFDFGMGNEVGVAVIGNGIDISNPYIKNKVAGYLDHENYDDNGNVHDIISTQDDNGHGTAVASVIASDRIENAFTGVAPRAKLYAYNTNLNFKLLEKVTNNIVSKKNEIAITSNSWAFSSMKQDFSSGGFFNASFNYALNAFKELSENGMINFAGAGNSGGRLGYGGIDDFGIENTVPAMIDEYGYTIGALTLNNNVWRRYVSGSQIDGYVDFLKDPVTGNVNRAWVMPTKNILDYVLPGENIPVLTSNQVTPSCSDNSLSNCYNLHGLTGTSFATPFASGIAAIIISNCNSPLTPGQVIDIMKNGVVDTVGTGRTQAQMWSGTNPAYYIGKGKLKLDLALSYMYSHYLQCVT
ncbi:MAG: S8/S53 family peptidase, partial [Candidatus Aenigmarchaeota archaeon]|nr:S8/S53 family peptidase [Candidatus Aenigmarchaeota archaeon]